MEFTFFLKKNSTTLKLIQTNDIREYDEPRVTKKYLKGRNFHEFPPFLFEMVYLTELHLSENNIRVIPNAISSLVTKKKSNQN